MNQCYLFGLCNFKAAHIGYTGRKRGKMTDYEKNKIIEIIKGMTEEEREVVIYALQEIYENKQE